MKTVYLVLVFVLCIQSVQQCAVGEDASIVESWRSTCQTRAENALAYIVKFEKATTMCQIAECLDVDARFVRGLVLETAWAIPPTLKMSLEMAESDGNDAVRKTAVAAIKGWAESPQISALAYAELVPSKAGDKALRALRVLGLPKQYHAACEEAWSSADISKIAAVLQWAKKRDKDGLQRKDFAQDMDFLGLSFRPRQLDVYMGVYQHISCPPCLRLSSYDERNALETVQVVYGHAVLSKEQYAAKHPQASRANYELFRLVPTLFDRDALRDEPPFALLDKLAPDGQIYAEKLWNAHGDKLFDSFTEWLAVNFKYLYLHPQEKLLKLDRDARQHSIPTAEYRKTHPWGANEGPNVTDEKKLPPSFGK